MITPKFYVSKQQGHGECFFGIGVNIGLSPYADEAQVKAAVDKLNKIFAQQNEEAARVDEQQNCVKDK